MIFLTRLDGRSILVHLPTIQYIEEIPDTLIVFTNHDRLIVKESMETIVNLTNRYLQNNRLETSQTDLNIMPDVTGGSTSDDRHDHQPTVVKDPYGYQ